MRKTLLTIAAAVLASSGAWGASLTEDEAPLGQLKKSEEDETLAQEVIHNMNEMIMDECNAVSDVKGEIFDRTARQRHMAVTLNDCINASAELAKEFERKPK